MRGAVLGVFSYQGSAQASALRAASSLAACFKSAKRTCALPSSDCCLLYVDAIRNHCHIRSIEQGAQQHGSRAGCRRAARCGRASARPRSTGRVSRARGRAARAGGQRFGGRVAAGASGGGGRRRARARGTARPSARQASTGHIARRAPRAAPCRRLLSGPIHGRGQGRWVAVSWHPPGPAWGRRGRSGRCGC